MCAATAAITTAGQASGLKGWSYAHLLPYFRRQEAWEGGADAYRGGDGPLATGLAHYDDPLVEACLAAGGEAGFPATRDYNGARQEGFGLLQHTIRRGRRCSAAVAYLRPALARRNLAVLHGTLACRVVFDGTRAAGVEYSVRRRAQRRHGRARGHRSPAAPSTRRSC